MKTSIKTVTTLLLILLSGLFISCEDTQNDRNVELSFDLRLPQDENGFLWVGTEDGLHRFNGYEFKLFTASPNDSNSIQDDHIRGLYAKGDTLWIASNTKGILGYQLSKNKFFALKKNNKNLNLGISYGIFPLNEDLSLFTIKNYATF